MTDDQDAAKGYDKLATKADSERIAYQSALCGLKPTYENYSKLADMDLSRDEKDLAIHNLKVGLRHCSEEDKVKLQQRIDEMEGKTVKQEDTESIPDLEEKLKSIK